MTRDIAIEVLTDLQDGSAGECWLAETIADAIDRKIENLHDALDMAIEALEREDHDGCDGCRYEANYELSLPCAECKQNYVDKYVPMPEHDREWIIGCIKHDGFVKTDRGDKANQIILEALKADRPRGEWINEDGTYYANCSKCGYQMDTHVERGYFRYCPNCGSDMRGENE